ncbi:MAG: tRNA uridine(34) 5-carboxymethylaminomethyl modification radical SAM/GNAT enzyme Elp3 [Dehalococcoidales bacterium]|jgi:elongator complex protein 3|nr:tRNA uridine(34) 5-carboxymethylaminomethyl modification radical SAM/GNAT enzyme Elp3 [Dehalococcoidales bacterium]MDD4794086.1 tRNA uridine(34) 5-carboxymethylaminomethyl modification radical SAM/GNAT enzyme Elp3 [Dehalococcoidales bacterium]MDD5121918.1 tRNA uridine(34) 5-carboxymethylaminomethyl modification radical SAM/GNAT enzyme Elp3 [Dehalococcoidales bacterium]MDD5498326.1 tRNA uridine(34) 5-carboxymethylaminomethyl modification radical SAM/GNAT enzyme Elp3 [Dehalococcoidales bacteriu
MQHHTIKKQSRTISGVTPVAVMTRPRPCPGNCVYCPTYSDTPQSYTPTSPAVLRAINCEYDPFKQVDLRLSILRGMGHPVDKVELIIMGGTFLSSPLQYQYDFIKSCFDALNGRVSASLEEAQQLNEEVECRCVGLCIETRPDYCTPAHIEWMVKMGTTRVELGVQAIDDDVYLLTRRGHKVEDVVNATRDLKMSGIKVHYHWMPNLPGVDRARDLELFSLLFSDERFRPDGLKMYPTMVVAGTELERWKEQGFYTPYTEEELIDLLADLKSLVPGYTRISRVLRDIPSIYITGGPKDSLREKVLKKLAEKGKSCQCIRCREYGHRIKQGWKTGKASLQRLEYKASGGQEIFLSFEDENQTLFGLLRLRLQSSPPPAFEGGQGAYALVRELHVYGAEVALGGRDDVSAQHKGLGKMLLAEAERIAVEEYGSRGIYILSGVGARPYYRSLGYMLTSSYMYRALPADLTNS